MVIFMTNQNAIGLKYSNHSFGVMHIGVANVTEIASSFCGTKLRLVRLDADISTGSVDIGCQNSAFGSDSSQIGQIGPKDQNTHYNPYLMGKPREIVGRCQRNCQRKSAEVVKKC